jgi:hypothetical protein
VASSNTSPIGSGGAPQRSPRGLRGPYPGVELDHVFSVLEFAATAARRYLTGVSTELLLGPGA